MSAPQMNSKTAVDQFDKEFQRYTTKHGGKGARAVAMARAELAKYNAMIFQDNKLQEKKITKGRLTPEQRAQYEKKIKDIEAALDKFHLDVAGYNKTKAGYAKFSLLSFVLLLTFALLAYLQPWNRLFQEEETA